MNPDGVALPTGVVGAAAKVYISVEEDAVSEAAAEGAAPYGPADGEVLIVVGAALKRYAKVVDVEPVVVVEVGESAASG